MPGACAADKGLILSDWVAGRMLSALPSADLQNPGSAGFSDTNHINHKGEAMKRILSYSAVIISLGLTASTALAQTTANGSYYAIPSWDQTLPANTRFIVLSNMNSEAVLDRETGLVWERSPSQTTRDWSASIEHCTNLNLGGRMGWRMPAISELFSLVDRSQSSPALPTGHPFLGVLFGTGAPGSDDFAAHSHTGNVTL